MTYTIQANLDELWLEYMFPAPGVMFTQCVCVDCEACICSTILCLLSRSNAMHYAVWWVTTQRLKNAGPKNDLWPHDCAEGVGEGGGGLS